MPCASKGPGDLPPSLFMEEMDIKQIATLMKL